MIPTLFTASCLWRGPNDSEQVIYFCGTSKQTFVNVSLVDSEDSEYTAQTAYKLVGTEPDDLNRIYKLKASDKIILNVSSSISYGIDSYKGYIEGNIQWVDKHVNKMKNEFDQDYFIEICKKISQKN
jgi:hypothetical protein